MTSSDMEKWNDALTIFTESVIKPDTKLRSCAHNQKCYNEIYFDDLLHCGIWFVRGEYEIFPSRHLLTVTTEVKNSQPCLSGTFADIHTIIQILINPV